MEFRFWPRLINNDMMCSASESLREALDRLDIERSLVLLFCVVSCQAIVIEQQWLCTVSVIAQASNM